MAKATAHHTTPQSPRRTCLWPVAAAIAAVAPYLHSLRWPFALDDWALIVEDPIAHRLAYIPKSFLIDFLHGNLGDSVPFYYRPLTTVSFQINYAMAGPNPYVFRLTNLLLNLIVVMAVFALAKRLSKSNFVAGIAAMSFAVLPSHAESVAWVSGRTDVIAALFILASLLVFAANYSRRPAFSWPLALMCSLFFAGALFSKESGLIVPLVILAYVWIFGGRVRRGEVFRWAMVLLPPLLVYAVLRKHVVGSSLEKHAFDMLWQRLAGVGIAYAAYLRMMFIPQELRVIYDVFPIGIRYPAVAAAAWLLPVGLVGLTVWTRKRAPVISFGALWVFLALLPVSNILPTIGPVPAERFVYLASVGSSMIIGWVAWRMYQWRPTRLRTWPMVAGLLVGWFVLYSGSLAVQSCRPYQSDVAWARAVAASKTRFASMRSMAGGRFLQAGLFREAAEEYEAVFALAREGQMTADDYVSLAIAKRRMGHPEQSARVLLAGRTSVGDDLKIEYHLGIAYALMGRFEQAAAAFRRATELNARSHRAWRGLGKTEFRLGRYREAVSAYERAFSGLQPTLGDLMELGKAYKGVGDLAKARREFERVARADPRGRTGKMAAAEIKALAAAGGISARTHR